MAQAQDRKITAPPVNPETQHFWDATAQGKLMIKKLRKDWFDRHPQAPLRQFHDSLMALGAPPLGLARDQLLGPGSGPVL